MRFSPAAFDRLLHGAVSQPVFWRQRSACPCTTATGSNDPRCGVCGGKGHIWAQEVGFSCGVTSQKVQTATTLFGFYDRGDCVLTIPRDAPSYMTARRFDRYRLGDAPIPFSEVVHPKLSPRLKGAVRCLTRAFHRDADGTALVELALPTVQANGALVWPPGGAPPPDTAVTIEGARANEVFCWDELPQHRNIGVSGLPLRLNARKLDLIGERSGASIPS